MCLFSLNKEDRLEKMYSVGIFEGIERLLLKSSSSWHNGSITGRVSIIISEGIKRGE